MDELDDVSGDLVWKGHCMLGNDLFLFSFDVVSFIEEGVLVSVFFDSQGEQVLSDKDSRNVTGITINILVTNIDLLKNLCLVVTLLFVDFNGVGMLFGIMNLLESAENPVVIFVLEVVELNQVTALDEVLLGVEVVHLEHICFLLQGFGEIIGPFSDQLLNGLFIFS